MRSVGSRPTAARGPSRRAFPDHWWSPWLGLSDGPLVALYPPPWLWLLAGVVGVAPAAAAELVGDRRAPARGLAMLLGTVMTVWAEPAYAVPVAPAFILFAAVALLGDRSTGRRRHEHDEHASSSAFRASR